MKFTVDVPEDTCKASLALCVSAVDVVVHSEWAQVDAEFTEVDREVDGVSLKSEVTVSELEALELISSRTEEICEPMLAPLSMVMEVLSQDKSVHDDGRIEEAEFDCDAVATGDGVT